MAPNDSSGKQTPPWEALSLVAAHLDPQTLAAATCVSRSWCLSLSAEHLWQPLCFSHFPSLSAAFYAASPPHVSYRRLYSLSHAAAKRRAKPSPRPRLGLSDLTFSFHVPGKATADHFWVSKAGKDILVHPEGLFLFDIYVNADAMDVGDHDEVMIMWNVVLRDWEAVFMMMECVGKVRLGSAEADGWFSEELPATESGGGGGGGGSGMTADLKLGFRGRKVEKMSVGIMSVAKWRYLKVEDGLRYLQHFLLPCDACSS